MYFLIDICTNGYKLFKLKEFQTRQCKVEQDLQVHMNFQINIKIKNFLTI